MNSNNNNMTSAPIRTCLLEKIKNFYIMKPLLYTQIAFY